MRIAFRILADVLALTVLIGAAAGLASAQESPKAKEAKKHKCSAALVPAVADQAGVTTCAPAAVLPCRCRVATEPGV